MDRNADFSVRVAVHSAQTPWQASPMKGVDRRMLDRLGDEVARATTIVRYEAGSSFPPHVHTGGEEFLVLDGVFQDEHGDYPAGSYIRNPPTSSHTPRSDEGCTILVKLWQFDMADRQHVTIDMAGSLYEPAADRPGVSVLPLYEAERELVRSEKWAAGSVVKLQATGGAEIFVLSGSFEENEELFTKGSWLRLPDGETVQMKAGTEGATVWVKTGHLLEIKRPS